MSQRQLLLVCYLSMWILAAWAIIVRSATERSVQLIAEPVILAIYTLFLVSFAVAALNVFHAKSFDIVQISGYIAIVISTMFLCHWCFAIPDDQIVIYLPTMVNFGVLVATTANNIERKTLPERVTV
ncbi:hypothetical protein F4810DRAFT_693686 [Camillea tinctor]|nr:hypothetical protein F4810DRAFT_693686 [Camillea tinctor]